MILLSGECQLFINEKSTSVQVMAWCRQAASHYLHQCYPGSATRHHHHFEIIVLSVSHSMGLAMNFSNSAKG